ncbi:hypothetical protein QE152_g23198 [Popillia japonica]|uniref:Uncharacterized protein n=1 Tax=Popillia japonica TaxID=7064 RepID=A0AAW1KIB0_POPJA
MKFTSGEEWTTYSEPQRRSCSTSTRKDAVCFLCDAWNEVSSSVLQKCWNKLTLMTEWNHDDLLPLAEIKELMEKEKKGLQTVYEMVQETEWNHDDLLPLAEIKELMEKEKKGLQTVP